MKNMSKIYTIGSLRNEKVPFIANELRNAGHEVFDDWYSAGPEADDYWQAYEAARGHNYKQALDGYAAKDVYNFDKHHLDRNDVVVLVLPAGKSGHLEFGYSIGKGKKGYILFDDDVQSCRWDVMYQFADGVFFKLDELVKQLQKDEKKEFKLVEVR